LPGARLRARAAETSTRERPVLFGRAWTRHLAAYAMRGRGNLMKKIAIAVAVIVIRKLLKKL